MQVGSDTCLAVLAAMALPSVGGVPASCWNCCKPKPRKKRMIRTGPRYPSA